MRILLVRPKPHKDTIGLQYVMICEPLELEYLASNIPPSLKGVLTCQIVDMILEKRPFRDILMDSRPDLVLFTGYITHVGTIKEMSQLVKSLLPHALTGAGGVHGEVVPEDFDHPALDLVFRRNAIRAFQNTLLMLQEGRGLDEIRDTIERVALMEPDYNFNLPDRKAVSSYRSSYYYMFHNPCALIKTSYGCPYSCSFCFCREVTRGRYHTRTMESVIGELEEIPEEEIYIVDDDFLFGREKLLRFAELLIKRGIKKNYLVYGRADFIAENRDIMEILKDSGLSAVIVGIESIRKKDLQDYRKNTTREVNESCIRILKELHIELYATMIVPLDFSARDFRDLAGWLVEQKVTFVNLQPLTPLPGTEIFEDYKEELLYGRDQYHVFDMAHVVLRPSEMSVRMFYTRLLWCYHRVVMRPSNIRRLLGKYGLRSNLRMLRGSQMVSLQYLRKIVRGY